MNHTITIEQLSGYVYETRLAASHSSFKSKLLIATHSLSAKGIDTSYVVRHNDNLIYNGKHFGVAIKHYNETIL